VLATIFADISPAALALIALAALVASVVGGVSGYGTGALMPLVLVPILGPAPVVPIIALSSLFSNAGRAAAFRRLIDTRRVLIVLAGAIPTCMLGAWGYTLLSGAGAMLLIGSMLVLVVALRRTLGRSGFTIGDRGLTAGAFGYGVFAGGANGAGVIIISLLMAAGLAGAAVIATDAALSVVIGLVRLATFAGAGVATPQVIAVALLIGAATFPGAFLARLMVERLPIHVHTVMLDGVVVIGGALMVIGAVRRMG